MITDCLWGGVPTYTYAKCVPYPWYRGVTTASTVCVCVCVCAHKGGSVCMCVCAHKGGSVCMCVCMCIGGREEKRRQKNNKIK